MPGTDASPRVLVAGETLVDLVAPDASLATADAFTPRVGGAPANVAAGLAALDEPPALWTRVGADGFGGRCRAALADHGVADAYVEVDPERETTVAFAAAEGDDRETDGDDLAFRFYRGADRHLGAAPGGVDPTAALGDVEVVVVGGIALAVDPARTAIVNLVHEAVDRDCTVVFDPNARPAAWTDDAYAAVTEELLGLADVVKATPRGLAAAGFDVADATPDDTAPGGADERLADTVSGEADERLADTVSGEADERLADARPRPAAATALAEAVCERGPHTTFLTLGADGAAAASTHRSPFGRGGASHYGHDVDPVDPTGAGDAFLAAVVAEVAGGATDPYAVLDVATAAGALATTERGAMPALPDREAVDELAATDGGVP
jgi:fructokinase